MCQIQSQIGLVVINFIECTLKYAHAKFARIDVVINSLDPF